LLKSSGKKQIENITIGVIAKKLAMSSQQVSRALKQLESNKDISIDIKVKENRHQALARLFNISVDINKFIYDYKDDP
jgi:CTP-dependent riboflavin kinase